MDPISVFGLAAGIIGVVGFALKFGNKYLHLFHSFNGKLEQNELQQITEDLTLLSADLQDSLTANQANELARNNRELFKIAQDCHRNSRQLIEVLLELREHQKSKAFGKNTRAVWAKKEIEAAVANLRSHREALDTRLLIDIRYVRKVLAHTCQ